MINDLMKIQVIFLSYHWSIDASAIILTLVLRMNEAFLEQVNLYYWW